MKMDENNEFWRFSLRLYGKPGVAQECIRLQDLHKINVNLLLFCAWLDATSRFGLGPKGITTCEGAIFEWNRNVVAPLRSLRRSLKSLPANSIRERVKELELDAEKHEQRILFELAEHWADDEKLPSSAFSNLKTLCAKYSLQTADVAPCLIAAMEAAL